MRRKIIVLCLFTFSWILMLCFALVLIGAFLFMGYEILTIEHPKDGVITIFTMGMCVGIFKMLEEAGTFDFKGSYEIIVDYFKEVKDEMRN